jgi:6-phosphofructokinase 1
MAFIEKKKGVIAILTGGGDVPGLNPAIGAIAMRAIKSGYRVIGLRRGWAGILELHRNKDADNYNNFRILTMDNASKAGRTGGTMLHTSRTRPSNVLRDAVPTQYKDQYCDEINDLTPEVIKNLDFLGVDHLIAIGGDDTLSYAVELHQQGVNVIGIPKTMDNDVPGTEYCIGFSTCITRTLQLTNTMRTSAGSHERILVVEVFGRYAGYTAMLPTLAGAASRCVIPEYNFDIELLTQLLVEDRAKHPSKYSVVLVSEGAKFESGEMVFEDSNIDAFGHKKLGGIGNLVSQEIKARSSNYNNGQTINIINQKLGYMVRGGEPDAIDSIIPMAYGSLALDLVLNNIHGRLVALKDGHYDHVPLDVVTSTNKVIDISQHYNTERLRPFNKDFLNKPLFFMTG